MNFTILVIVIRLYCNPSSSLTLNLRKNVRCVYRTEQLISFTLLVLCQIISRALTLKRLFLYVCDIDLHCFYQSNIIKLNIRNINLYPFQFTNGYAKPHKTLSIVVFFLLLLKIRFEVKISYASISFV